MARRPGVFCVEGDWSTRLQDRSSMQSLLGCLEDADVIDAVYRRASTATELHALLDRWTQKQHAGLVVGYLAFHGAPGEIRVGRERVTLSDLGERLADRCSGRVVHFGACSVLDVETDQLKEFLRRTGARAVCGYTKDVDWLQSAAFDFLLLNELTRSQHLGHALRRLEREYGVLPETLGFGLVTPHGKEP